MNLTRTLTNVPKIQWFENLLLTFSQSLDKQVEIKSNIITIEETVKECLHCQLVDERYYNLKTFKIDTMSHNSQFNIFIGKIEKFLFNILKTK